jgi:predicted nucleic acid-binding protein
MTARTRFTLDTNLLVYAVDRDAGDRHGRAAELVLRAAEADCVLPLQVLGEFFHATTRKGLLPATRAAAFVRDWLDVFDVAAADDAVLVQAMDAVAEHQLSFWDAMLWATARAAGCTALLSEDMQDGRRLGGVEIVNPFAADAGERLSPLLDGR